MDSNGTRETGRNAASTAFPLAEIEGLFGGSPGVYDEAGHSGQERRFRAIGPTNTGRYLFVAFTVREVRGRTVIRPISARYMHDKEVRHYEQRKAPQAHAAPEK